MPGTRTEQRAGAGEPGHAASIILLSPVLKESRESTPESQL